MRTAQLPIPEFGAANDDEFRGGCLVSSHVLCAIRKYSWLMEAVILGLRVACCWQSMCMM
jgi:hypothetical protein